MATRPWESEWRSYKAAEDEYRRSIEELLRNPAEDPQQRDEAIAAARRKNSAWATFEKAFRAHEG